MPQEGRVAVQARDPRRSRAYAAALRRTGKHAPINAIHQNTMTAWAYGEGTFAHVIGPNPTPEGGHGGPPDEIVCITINASTTPRVTSTIQLSRHPHRRTPNTVRTIPARRNGNPTLRIATTPTPKTSPVTTQNDIVLAVFTTRSGSEGLCSSTLAVRNTQGGALAPTAAFARTRMRVISGSNSGSAATVAARRSPKYSTNSGVPTSAQSGGTQAYITPRPTL